MVTIWSFFSSYVQWRIHDFVGRCVDSLQPGNIVLDAGAGECPFADYFKFAGMKYISQDSGTLLSPGVIPHQHIVSDITAIPLADNSVDAVLCTQVLEHVRSPKAALRELHRVLKPGGKLWLTVPHISREHFAPYDYWRYTRYIIAVLADGAGFRVVSCKPMGGVGTTIAGWVNHWWMFRAEAGRLKAAGTPAAKRRKALYWTSKVMWFPIAVVVGALGHLVDLIVDPRSTGTPNFEAILEKW